ncbi:MAG: hypothetical protein NWR60_04670 [Candidatus Nanopelagicales bacterium]|nr:hypothetical protein [Candidatus Nanopelagicales bacterium]
MMQPDQGGMVSPPIPLLNVQAMVTRRTPSGELHGPEQVLLTLHSIRTCTPRLSRAKRAVVDVNTVAHGWLAP